MSTRSYGATIVDFIDRNLRLRMAEGYIRETGWVLMPDPTPFPRLHLFPTAYRACRPLRRWRLDLHLWRRRRAAA